METEQPRRDCPICGRDNRAQCANAFSRPRWELKECAGCSLVYLENPPAYASLQDEFAWEKTWAEEGGRRRQREPVFYYGSRALQAIPKKLFRRDKLMRWVRRYFQPGPVLDVGCAGGHTLERLPSQFIPFGVEVSRGLAELADTRFSPRGGGVLQGDALSTLPRFEPEFFSGVIMSSYLEHEVQPAAALAAGVRILRPGGRLIVKVPNFASWNRAIRGARWCGFRYPDHVNYYTPALLTRLLRDSGLHILRFSFLDRFPTSDNMWLVAEK